MSTILVTGAAGFIGSHFVDYAVQQGRNVVGLDDLSYGVMANVHPDTTFHQADVREFASIERIVVDTAPEAIVHFAANATTKSSAMGWNHPLDDYAINMVGTLNLLEIIRRNEMKTRLVYASTAAVYGEPQRVPVDESHPLDPLSPYGVSKLAGEKYCYAYGRECGVQTTVFRIFNTFGPRQPRYIMYDQITKMLAAKGGVEVLGTGEQLRDYAFVSDVVRAFYLGMTRDEAVGQVFNVAGGNKTSVKELVMLIRDLLKVDVELTFTGQSWRGDISRLWADTSKLTETLGWSPDVSLEDGLSRLIAWINETA